VTPTEPSRRAGVIAIRPRDVEGASQRLKDGRVFHAVREGCVRLAPHLYNTAAEVELALRLVAG